MRHVQGNGFTFAVLDDVLMSVDTGHRREVCALLKKEFPTTQFVLTTHDPIWLRHMKTEGLVTGRSAVQFRSWDVDLGPAQWDNRDVWTEIADDLKRNNVLPPQVCCGITLSIFPGSFAIVYGHLWSIGLTHNINLGSCYRRR